MTKSRAQLKREGLDWKVKTITPSTGAAMAKEGRGVPMFLAASETNRPCTRFERHQPGFFALGGLIQLWMAKTVSCPPSAV